MATSRYSPKPHTLATLAIVCSLGLACGSEEEQGNRNLVPDGGKTDSGTTDGGTTDGGTTDGSVTDASEDTGVSGDSAVDGSLDAGADSTPPVDSGIDGPVSTTPTKFGIFYHTWHCRAAHANPIHDLSEVQAGHQGWDPSYATFYWWDEPGPGYYCLSENDALLAQHAELIRDAGIDFVFLDVTNHNYVGSGSDDTPGMILAPLDRLLDVWSTIPGAPKIVAWVPVEGNVEDPSRFTVDAINARMANYPDMQFIYEGKPLLLVTENAVHPVNLARVAQLAATHTVRHMWAHIPYQPFYRPGLWSFLEICQKHPSGNEPCNQYTAMLNGSPEQVTVTTAYQYDYMSVPGAVPKLQGRTFRKQFETAFNNPDVPIVTITGWNEWIAQRQPCGIASCDCATYPDGCFLDAWDIEFSRDIEPGKNPMGDYYYRLLSSCVGLYRQGARCDAAHAQELCCKDYTP